MKKVLPEVIEKKVEKIYVCSFNEEAECKVHFHLIPRYSNQKNRGPNLLKNNIKNNLPLTNQKLIVERIKNELN